MTSELKRGTTRILTRGILTHRILTHGALIAACGLAAAACGSTAAPSATGGGSSSAATTSAAKVSLTVTETGGSGTTAKHWTLRCEPAGGSFPDPAAACAKLTNLRTIFNPTPGRHVMCPMIMADARTYIVYGTFLGQKVHERIADGGCTLARWNKLNQIFN